MNYPLQLSFEILSVARKLSVVDAAGSLNFFVKQKMFKLKESVTVFADADQKLPLYELKADRVIDFSASYHFNDARGAHLGTVRRKGMKSLWRARYDIVNGGGPVLTIQEANPWTKVFDSLFCEIPIVGMFSGYVFHPEYLVARQDGTAVMRLKKEPAFFQGKFSIEKLAEMSKEEETRILLSLIMMVLLERQRG
ncbi:MAG TPA: hypothetical protein VFR51_05315 [Pyrinomonadaceae bacterium]|nr:hypothetical protein [Pyrinomonadaceae bacterium]